MLFENKVNNNFKAKVQEVSNKLGINPDWLMAVMMMESNINPQAVNLVSGATGLIQFMPATAIGLGTTTAALKSMTGVQQLDYVYKYFYPYRSKLYSLYDLYMVTFFPLFVGETNPEKVIQGGGLSAGIIAKQNPTMDINKDGQVTVGEFQQYIDKRLKSFGLTEQQIIELTKKKDF